MRVYLIPGLGYTEQIFEKLRLNGAQIKSLNWLEPKANESIENYAGRMAEQMVFSDDEVVLIGHSFGGILCQEIARRYQVDKVILLSSIQSRAENPLQFRILKPLGLHRIITKSFILKTFPFWGHQHGFVSKEEKALFPQMVGRYSNNYYRWALWHLSTWENKATSVQQNIVRIHGEQDKTFPINLVQQVDHLVKGGSHIMVYKQSALVSDILNQELAKL